MDLRGLGRLRIERPVVARKATDPEACTCAGQGRWAVEWLFLLGIGGAMGASIHATVMGGEAIYYDVVAVLLTVYATGKALTAAARARAVQESQRLAAAFATANVIRDGCQVPVPVCELQAGGTGSGCRLEVRFRWMVEWLSGWPMSTRAC